MNLLLDHESRPRVFCISPRLAASCGGVCRSIHCACCLQSDQPARHIMIVSYSLAFYVLALYIGKPWKQYKAGNQAERGCVEADETSGV